MKNEINPYEEEMRNVVHRFENMMENNVRSYFGESECAEVIDFYLHNKNLRSASKATEFAKKMYPHSTLIRIRKVYVLINKGEHNEALFELEEIEKKEKSNLEIHFLKGNVHLSLGNFNESIREFKQISTQNPDDKSYVLYSIGLAFSQKKKFEKALKYFVKAHNFDKKNFYVIYEMGFCYEKTKQPAKALECYLQYVGQYPFDNFIWGNIARMYLATGNSEKALEAIEFALALNPKFAFMYYLKGNILAAQENYPKAIECYSEYLNLKPNFAIGHFAIAECYEKNEQFAKAFDEYHKTVTLAPKYASAWTGMGMCLFRFQKYAESIHYLKRAIKISKRADHFCVLGQSYLRLWLLDKAEKYLRRTVKLDPHFFLYWVIYSEVFFFQGNIDKAVLVLQKGYDYNSESAALNYRLAAYLFLIDLRDSGFYHLEKALKLNFELLETFWDVYDCKKDSGIRKLVRKYSSKK